jgi:hypothetical protein
VTSSAGAAADPSGTGPPPTWSSTAEWTRKGWTASSPFPKEELANDPVEWGSFVGARCAKLLPKEYKVSYKKLLKNHSHTWF